MKKRKLNNQIGNRKHDVRKNNYVFQRLVLFLLTIILGFWAATQWTAYKFGFQAGLGVNIEGVYSPHKIIEWYLSWGKYYENIFMQSISIGFLTTIVLLIFFAIYVVAQSNSSKSKANEFLHGSAEWATEKDVKNAGLLEGEGVYVGGWIDDKGQFNYLRHSGPEHVLTFAPTRSGKGVGLILPTLLSWPHSTFVSDLKGELYALTSGWRKNHANNKILKFEPASSSGCARWNPLDEIRIGSENEIADAQNLAILVVDPNGKGLRDHWQKTSYMLLVGLILHVIYKSKIDDTVIPSLAGVDALLADPKYASDDEKKAMQGLWNEMLHNLHIDGLKAHPVVSAAGKDMLDKPEDEGGSVLSTLKTYLSLYRDPIVAKNTNVSDFKLRQLMDYSDPVSLYAIAQPTDKERLKPLMRIMVNMVIRLNAGGMDFKNGRAVANYKHRLLMMLDELPSLGKLEILQESLAFLAGYGIKAYLICQDTTQLRSRETGYGPEESITSNCHVQIAYQPNRLETAEYLSKMTGITTVTKEKITTSGKRVSVMDSQVSRSVEEISRPLMTADEVQRMPGPKKDLDGSIVESGDMLVFVTGYPAIYGKQPLYFKDPIFQKRSEIPAPVKSDLLIKSNRLRENEKVSLD
ncbi:Conjugal transfer protein traG [Phocoenobacter uteri]|uniref:Conjugal transfer protein traG n=1 Tax=Phocoenobacter uteri TaxID=146806 RepID=A0A379DEM1_9PAST|nr:type IV secretory system conjugative DNA transfer family protein [Phocoenobacter uteri]MDG6882829.1 conjugal transfer protein TraG [Phocoenobacter uteri]SUB76384.1 Conjugal transfer protein traG [Phocoenobacter uteri]SUB76426.1 Conjugal transfer protein traG [Phocoenobacter uteri]